MIQSDMGRKTIEAELRLPMATAQIVHFISHEPGEAAFDEPAFQIYHYLSARPSDAAGRFSNRWRPSHYEKFGDLFAVPPGESIVGRSGASQGTCITLLLQSEHMQSWLPRNFEWTDARLAACLNISHPTLRSLLLRLANEVENPGLGAHVLAECIAVQSAIELGRYCGALEETIGKGGLPPWRLRLIEERIEDVGAPPSLAELATLCNLSPRQLKRAFRASYGYPISTYVTHKRADQAKRLLSGDKSVKTIAHELGYRSSAAFCFAFRKTTGETPGEYRQRTLQEHLIRS